MVTVPVFFLILLLRISCLYLAVYKGFSHAFSKISYCKNHTFKYFGASVSCLLSEVSSWQMSPVACILYTSDALCASLLSRNVTHTPNNVCLFVSVSFMKSRLRVVLFVLEWNACWKLGTYKSSMDSVVFNIFVSFCLCVINKHV